MGVLEDFLRKKKINYIYNIIKERKPLINVGESTDEC